MHGIRYREHAPPPDLSAAVECFWTLRSHGPLPAARLNRVLPDGCTDVIVNLGDEPLGLPRPRSYVVGAMRRPAEVWMAGSVDLLGVRFRPGGMAALLPLPAAEVTDTVLALPDAWGPSASDLESRLYEAPDAERIPLLAGVLRRRYAGGPRVHAAVARASELIAASRGAVPVHRLGEAVGLTPRHLERLFAEQVGLTPKLACRVARFRHVLRALELRPGAGWSRLALECGYADQAHLVRDFRAFAGLPPEAYRRERADVASVQDAGAAAG